LLPFSSPSALSFTPPSSPTIEDSRAGSFSAACGSPCARPFPQMGMGYDFSQVDELLNAVFSSTPRFTYSTFRRLMSYYSNTGQVSASGSIQFRSIRVARVFGKLRSNLSIQRALDCTGGGNRFNCCASAAKVNEEGEGNKGSYGIQLCTQAHCKACILTCSQVLNFACGLKAIERQILRHPMPQVDLYDRDSFRRRPRS
jgi:hypothetical protein